MAENFNNLENTNTNNLKTKIYCKKCNKNIRKKIQDIEICNTCVSDLKRDFKQKQKDEKEKLKQEKLNSKNKLMELVYNDEIKVSLRTTEKLCKCCNQTKSYLEFYALRDYKSKNNKYYLSPRCKICCSKFQVKKST
jgi:hypothetical protein